jgi:uncharacterized protein YndB with AHSA1/START domain
LHIPEACMTDLIERELDLSAAPADVWRAITDPDWLSGWLADRVALELRPGGEARFEVGDEVREGWVEEVMSPDGGDGRLTFWWARGDEPASRVELVISAVSDGSTRLRVVETRPLEILDLVGIPFGGAGGPRYGPSLVAA